MWYIAIIVALVYSASEANENITNTDSTGRPGLNKR